MPTRSPPSRAPSDGGGVRTAALRPITGADRVVRWLQGIAAKNQPAPIADTGTWELEDRDDRRFVFVLSVVPIRVATPSSGPVRTTTTGSCT